MSVKHNRASENITQFEHRKQDHIELALDSSNQTSQYSCLADITLHHCALPELDFADISLQTNSLNQTLACPLFISSMTAGHVKGVDLNKRFAQAAQARGWAMGVGSQRRELYDDKAAQEWQIVRQSAPNASLFSNIGLSQLINTPLSDIQRLIDNLQAHAIIVHTNPLQECLQPEGTPHFKGGLAALEQLCQSLTIPVILKETGCGFALDTLQKLDNIGLAAVDVSGLGGTHWGRIEGGRSAPDSLLANCAQTFKNWGVTTIDSLLNAKKLNPRYEVWGSGGVRSGLDAAKLIALGAKRVGLAKPILAAALVSEEALDTCMQQIEHELKIALFCTGQQNPEQLRMGDVWHCENT